MSSIRIPVFPVTQPIGTFYVAKMNATELLRMSTVDRRHIDEDDEVIGIQRPLKQEKVREIKKYLTTQNATFPNSIIVNVKRDRVVHETPTELEIIDSEDAFTIIDGQHRLYGFEGYVGRPFELILSIFLGLEVTLQSEVFSIINSQQTKVDPSLNINLELADDTDNPRKVLVQIAESFNLDKKSPWYKQIRMLGGQSDGIISLVSFVRPLFNLTYPEKYWVNIKNRLEENKPNFPSDWSDIKVDIHRYPFWSFYINKQQTVIYKILLNYFTAFSRVFDKDWMNPDSILNKTTGYNAMMRLFTTAFYRGIHAGDLTEGFFFNFIAPLAKMQETITSDIYGSSGLYSSNMLYKDMLTTLNLEGLPSGIE